MFSKKIFFIGAFLALINNTTCVIICSEQKNVCSEKAEKIVDYGSLNRTLIELSNTDKAEYALPHDEPYARFVVYFDSGEVIYTNPFARYNKSLGDYPTTNSKHSVNITLTILYNLLLAALCGATIMATYRLWRKRDKKHE